MSSKKRTELNEPVPNDGTYLAAKKAKQLKNKKVKEDFDQAWESQGVLLKNSAVKLYKDKTTIGVQWQSPIDYEDKPLVKPMRVKKGLNSLGRGKFPHAAKAVATKRIKTESYTRERITPQQLDALFNF